VLCKEYIGEDTENTVAHDCIQSHHYLMVGVPKNPSDAEVLSAIQELEGLGIVLQVSPSTKMHYRDEPRYRQWWQAVSKTGQPMYSYTGFELYGIVYKLHHPELGYYVKIDTENHGI